MAILGDMSSNTTQNATVFTEKDLFYLKIRHIFKSCNIYLKPERFVNESLHYQRYSDFTFDNVNFDLRKRSGFIYILQFLNICLIFK